MAGVRGFEPPASSNCCWIPIVEYSKVKSFKPKITSAERLVSKKKLQIATCVLALVPTLTGLVGMLGLGDPLYGNLDLPRDATLDSQLRFYNGVWMGLGMAAFWLVPRIETETTLFRFLWLMIFIGGIGRLLSLVLTGMPFPPFIGFTVLEIIGAPLFIQWQGRLARAAGQAIPTRAL